MRIVSLSPAATEVLLAIGAGSDIVATRASADYPEQARRLPQLFQGSDIFAYAPDLVITEASNAELPGAFTYNPVSIHDVFESIVRLGYTVGRQLQASELAGEMLASLEHLRVVSPQQQPRVYVEIDPTPLAGGYWIPELVEYAGGKAVLAEPGHQHRTVTVDAVTGANPDLIVLHWLEGYGTPSFEEIANRPGWQDVPAVATGAIAHVTGTALHRAGPRLVDGARQLQLLYRKLR